MKKQIVIVDDFETTRWVVSFALRNIDCEIMKAENGEEALKFFDGRDIDLLITDYNMPIMSGLELAKKIRQMEDYKFLPILMLTTEVNPEKKEKTKYVRLTAWVQKPFKQEEFLKIIRRSLKIKETEADKQ